MGCGNSVSSVQHDEPVNHELPAVDDVDNAKVGKGKGSKKKTQTGKKKANAGNNNNNNTSADDNDNVGSGGVKSKGKKQTGKKGVGFQDDAVGGGDNNNNPSSKQSKKQHKKYYKYTINQEIPGLIEENITQTPNTLPFQFFIVQSIQAHTQAVTCLIELQNQAMASGSLDRTIKLWGKSKTGQFTLYRTYQGHTDGVLAIREMPELKALCSCSIDCCVKIWELKSSNCVATLKGHTMPIISVDYSPALQYIFSGGDDTTVRIWNASSHKIVKVLKENKQSVSAVLYVDAHSYLVTGSDDKMLKFYSGKNNFEWVKTIDTLLSEIVCLKYAGSRVLVSCQDGNVYFINIKLLKRIRSVKFSNDAIHDFFVMDHETYLVTGGTDGKGRVWKVGTGERSLLNGHTKEINGIILLSDGRIATASGDKSIIVWIADHQIEDAEEPVDEYDDDDD